jgi:hypothetical protein
MNHGLVLRITGMLLLLEALAMWGCGLFARFDVVAGDEEAMAALFKSGGITAALAVGMILAGGVRQQIQGIPRREAVVVVGLGWLLSSCRICCVRRD